MENNFRIPLEFECGEYGIRYFNMFCLPEYEDYECIELNLSKNKVLTYNLPYSDIEVKINSVSEFDFASTLRAIYDKYGSLLCVRFKRKDRTKLIYVRLDEQSAEDWAKNFLNVHSIDIANEVKNRQKKQSRLFFCYTCNDDDVYLDMKLCPNDEYQRLKNLGANVNKSSSYSKKYSIDDCFDNLKTIILCTPENLRKKLFAFSVYYIMNNIISNVIEKIDKTEDFKFIAEHD